MIAGIEKPTLNAADSALLANGWNQDTTSRPGSRVGVHGGLQVQIVRKDCSAEMGARLQHLIAEAGIELGFAATEVNHIDRENSKNPDRAVQIQLTETAYNQVCRHHGLELAKIAR